MGVEVKCKLWYTRRQEIRMGPECKNYFVRNRKAVCDHYISERAKPKGAPNVTDQCRRAQEARKLGPIDQLPDKWERQRKKRRKRR